MTQPKKLFCFGFGYTCHYLATQLQAPRLETSPESSFGQPMDGQSDSQQWRIAGTTRGMEKRAALRSNGIEAHIFDSEKPLGDPEGMLEGTTHLLISTPPDQSGDTVFHYHADHILDLMPQLEWVGYLSTTGVYGDRDGAWVDENSNVKPSSIRGTRRVRAESEWLSLWSSYQIPVHIFRLAGIYGPGRCALDSVRSGIARRIIKPGHAFCRIHVEDIAQTLLKSMIRPNPGQIYNVADDEPAPSHEVIAYASRLLGKEPPPLVRFDDANLAPITLSFYSENKSVKNTKIKQDLGVKLCYPNFRKGLDACLSEEKKYESLGQSLPWVVMAGSDYAENVGV